MVQAIVALALKPQDVPPALRQNSVQFHQNVRTVTKEPDAVLTPIDSLDDSNINQLREWRKRGTLIIDYTDQERKSPLSDSVISTKWDDHIKIMRFAEAINHFSPAGSDIKSADEGVTSHLELGLFIAKVTKLKRSGILICREDQREHRFHFTKGRLFLISSNVEGEHLGSYLVHHGKITPGHFQSATKKFFSTGKRIGQCLISVGALTAETLNKILEEHQEFLGAATFDWQGTWSFYPLEPKLPNDLSFKLNVSRMLLQAVNSVKEFAPPSPLPWEDTYLVMMNPVLLEELPFTPDQYYLIDQLKEKKLEVRHLCSLLPPPEKQKDRTLCQLYMAGVIRIFTFDPIDEVVERAEKAKKQTYYEIFDLQTNASSEDIRKKYYEFARKYHPDKFVGSERFLMVKEMVEMYFSTINEAYQIIFDPEQRKLYDKKTSRMDERQLNPEEKIVEFMRDVRKAMANSQYNLAYQKLNEIVYLGGKTAEVYRLIGQCMLTDPSRLKETEATLKQSLALDANNPDTHFLLAKLYLKAGMQSRAIRHLQETSKLQPGHFEAESLLKDLNG